MEKKARNDGIEVTSQTMQDELVAIKERLNAIETIQSISNASIVQKYVEEHLTTAKAKDIMRECEEPRTKAHLVAHFKFNSTQALDHHLRPLREADLIRQLSEPDGTVLFEWSNLFKRQPRSTIKSLLGGK